MTFASKQNTKKGHNKTLYLFAVTINPNGMYDFTEIWPKQLKKTLEYTLALKTTKNKLLPLKRLSHEAYRFASASTINIKPLPQEAS